MEIQLFHAYLKYLKDNDVPAWKIFISMPKKTFFIFIIAIVALVCCCVFSLFNMSAPGLISSVAALVLFLIFISTITKDLINKSEDFFAERKISCLRFLEWLKKFDITTSEEIQMYKDRIEKRIALKKEDNHKRLENFFKLMQVLIIPIIIAAYSFFINRQKSTYLVIVYTCIGLIFIGVVCGFVYVIKSMIISFQKFSIEKMQRFANDLQGALDCMKYVKVDTTVSDTNDENSQTEMV